MVDQAFVKFTGWSWHDASCKLALLSLKHPCAVAIQRAFEQTKVVFEQVPEILNLTTGRFGRVGFVADEIDGNVMTIREIRHTAGLARSRNDCCGHRGKTFSLCSMCKIAYCQLCTKMRRTQKVQGWSGITPVCNCAFNGDWERQGLRQKFLARSAAYMVEVLVEDGVYELQPVFLRACFTGRSYPVREAWY